MTAQLEESQSIDESLADDLNLRLSGGSPKLYMFIHI